MSREHEHNPGAVMPDWLQPYKNEWRSMSGIQQIMQFPDRPFSSWFHEVKGRLRSIKRPGRNGTLATHYLVKHVWACARAHGHTALPTSESTPIEDQILALQAQNEALRQSLAEARDQVRHLEGELVWKEKIAAVARTTWSAEMRKLIAMCFTTTEARSAPGVYFLLSEDGVVAYVGQSKNVLSRMSGHAEKTFFTVRMVHQPDPAKRLELEAELIDMLQPPLNTQGIRKEPA